MALDFVGDESGVTSCEGVVRGTEVLDEDDGSTLIGSWPLTDLTMMR